MWKWASYTWKETWNGDNDHLDYREEQPQEYPALYPACGTNFEIIYFKNI